MHSGEQGVQVSGDVELVQHPDQGERPLNRPVSGDSKQV
jgi:hypothetical protein